MTSLQQANIDEMREIASRICRDYLTGAWKSITAKDIKLKRISGGLSNFLYYVSLPDANDSCSSDSNSNLTVSNHTIVKVKSTEAKRVRKDSGGSSFCEPKEVLLRIYGQIHGENALETMLTESVVFTLLSERNLGPKLHGIFPGGRIEQYIPARALKTNELSDYKISMKIAEKMAEIHSLNIPVSKEPDWLWNSMNRWLHTIDSILNDFKINDNNKQFQTQFNEIKSTNLKNEIKWIKSIIKMNNFPVVFCHNDLQEGNILLKEDSINTNRSSSLSSSVSSYTENNLSVLEDSGASSNSENNHHFSELGQSESNGKLSNIINGNTRKRSLRSEDIFCDLDNTRDSVLSGNSEHSDYNYVPDIIIIDYEYCAYNYRGFDLANHFIEWTLDYTANDYPFFEHQKSQYPNKQQKYEFIETYLRKLNEFNYGYNNIIDDDVVNNDNDNIKKSDIKKVDEEIRVFTMVSHLFWCLWGIVNVHQAIEFGYWDYAVCRLRQYLQVKEEFITAKSNGKK